MNTSANPHRQYGSHTIPDPILLQPRFFPFVLPFLNTLWQCIQAGGLEHFTFLVGSSKAEMLLMRQFYPSGFSYSEADIGRAGVTKKGTRFSFNSNIGTVIGMMF